MRVTPLLVTVSEARDLPERDASTKTDAFAIVEAGGARHTTEVQRLTTSPVWDFTSTLRAHFSAGTREELTIHVWHEDVFEDVLLGSAAVDLSAVLHERAAFDGWVPLLDESGLRSVGAEVHLRIENGAAPSLASLCASPDVSLELLEQTLAQDVSQADERAVADASMGRLPLHVLISNLSMTDEMLALLLKTNSRQARVADKHGNLPLVYLCRRWAPSETQLALLLQCHPAAAHTPNRCAPTPAADGARASAVPPRPHRGAPPPHRRFAKLPLHFLARNPSVTKPLLLALIAARRCCCRRRRRRRCDGEALVSTCHDASGASRLDRRV